jgi:hypothetical protein
MKKTIITIISSLTMSSLLMAHGNVEIGPNGGRVLEFSKNESTHGEVLVSDKQFQISLLDKDKKPVRLAEQDLIATSGDRAKPEKLAVEKKDGKFVLPVVKSGEWVIFQFRENAGAKPVTARFNYDTDLCGGCKQPEWICKCNSKESKGK